MGNWYNGKPDNTEFEFPDSKNNARSNYASKRVSKRLHGLGPWLCVQRALHTAAADACLGPKNRVQTGLAQSKTMGKTCLYLMFCSQKAIGHSCEILYRSVTGTEKSMITRNSAM